MLAGSFVPQNDLDELTKLPQLLAHYRFHHSAAGGSLSLTEFLVEYYGSGAKQHFGCMFSSQHRRDHQGLPLHGRHTSGGVAFVPPPAHPVLTLGASAWQEQAAWRFMDPKRYRGGPGAVLLPPRA